jgi:hypothetical protein
MHPCKNVYANVLLTCVLSSAQERKRVEEVSRGVVDDEAGLPAVQFIPPIMQLFPDVEVEHADDSSSIVSRARSGKWTWVFAGRTVYLAAPVSNAKDISESMHETVRIMHHKDVAPLLEAYLRGTGQLVAS